MILYDIGGKSSQLSQPRIHEHRSFSFKNFPTATVGEF